MHKGACCSGNQAAKLQGLLLQLAAPKAPKVFRQGRESEPLGPLSLLRKEHTSGAQGSFSFPLSLFERINCHPPTQSGCLLLWPQSSHPQTHCPAASCPDQRWEPVGEGGDSGGHLGVGPPPTHTAGPQVSQRVGRKCLSVSREEGLVSFITFASRCLLVHVPLPAHPPSQRALALVNGTGGPTPRMPELCFPFSGLL